MNNRTIHRLEQFIKHLDIPIKEFEITINVSNGYMGKQIKKGGSIGSNIIEKVLKAYPQLNVVWLITGKEEMIEKIDKTSITDKMLTNSKIRANA